MPRVVYLFPIVERLWWSWLHASSPEDPRTKDNDPIYQGEDDAFGNHDAEYIDENFGVVDRRVQE